MMHRTDARHDDAFARSSHAPDHATAPTAPRFERAASPSASKAEDIIALLNSRIRSAETRR